MGFGDEIMASAEARRLKRDDPHARVVIGDGRREVWSAAAEEVFAGNPHVSRLAEVRGGDRVRWLRNYYGCRPYLDYARGEPGRRQAFASYRAMAGEIFFSAAETAAAAAIVAAARGVGRPVVSVEPHTAFGPNKDWGLERWQALVDALQPHVVFLQPSYGRPLLAGVRGVAATFRGWAAVLRACDLHVGPEGGLHHAAAAVGCGAVVLFGGRISPRLTGYDGHENLYVDAPGSPCGMQAACAHCRACFASIAVETVAAAVLRHVEAAAARFQGAGSSRRSASTTRAVACG